MDYPSLLAHPQVDALGAIVEIELPTAGSFKTVRPVARFSETPDAITCPPPTLGQHTVEVLRTVGIDDAGIERLKVAGVIATG
jgi:crotonobetainyl-CoA:carnitine CoA-transferase CaiB-like acyl-CoA transferase